MIDPITITKSSDPRRLPHKGVILVAHQAEFLPYLGNISKAAMGDVYILMDSLQFVKQHWQSRNKIRIKGGDGFQWLTIPLKGVKNHIFRTDEVVIDGVNWKSQHLKTIELSYKKTPYFEEIFSELSEIYSKEYVLLIDFLVDLIMFAFRKFNITIPVYRASELIKHGYPLDGKKSDLVIEICKAVNADVFVFGQVGRTYVDKDVFFENGIKFVFQDFVHPVYSQIQGDFISHIAFIDLLFNHGSNAIKILGKSNYLEE